MSLIYEPEVEENNSYTLKIEWIDVDANFTHYVEDEVTDVFNTSSFCEFMNEYYDNNIRLIDVTIDQELYLELFVNIDAYIDFINFHRDNFSINFLAISPNEKQKLIVRNIDLCFFPKFFENWKIIPLTGHTTNDYQTIFKHLIALDFKGTNNWKFADYLFFTLVNKKIQKDNRFGFGHQPQFRSTVEEYKSQHIAFLNYMQLGIASDALQDWDNICNSLYCWFTRDNEENAKSMSLFDEYTKLKELMSDVELFPVAYQDFEQQNELFIGLPFDLLNRRLTINF
jgi:hypothetical protein